MNGPTTIQGGCHCGDIRYTFYTLLPVQQLPYRMCGCDFCRRQGAVYTSDPAGRLVLHYGSEINGYRFASREVEFVSCCHCGIMTHALYVAQGRQFAVLNSNTFDSIPLDRQITRRDFAQEDPAAACQRRMQNWIPDVTIHYQAAAHA